MATVIDPRRRMVRRQIAGRGIADRDIAVRAIAEGAPRGWSASCRWPISPRPSAASKSAMPLRQIAQPGGEHTQGANERSGGM
jgi:hypothetical protein